MASETAEDTLPPPTFEGRLKLASFMFNGGGPVSAGPRRSPRLSATATPSPPAQPPVSTARSPSKRKALTLTTTDTNIVDDDDATPTSSSTSSSSAATPRSKAKRARRAQKVPSSYAPPSAYAHLRGIPDAMGPNLLVLFIGLNPGVETARTGHAYAHPTNLFWRLLHSSGVTPRLCAPSEDRSLPARYALGLTNIVARPSRSGAELSRAEMDAGVAVLEEKVRRWRPEAVCVVGKSIWESVWRVRHGRPIRPAEFRYGWQDEAENMGMLGEGGVQRDEEREEGVDYSGDWKGARIFVATSTSGLAATLKPKEKEAIWKELGEWTVRRRAERAAAAAPTATVTPTAVVGQV